MDLTMQVDKDRVNILSEILAEENFVKFAFEKIDHYRTHELANLKRGSKEYSELEVKILNYTNLAALRFSQLVCLKAKIGIVGNSWYKNKE